MSFLRIEDLSKIYYSRILYYGFFVVLPSLYQKLAELKIGATKLSAIQYIFISLPMNVFITFVIT